MTVHGLHREASIEIHTSPEAVYDLVSDLPRMGEWSPENIGGEWQGGGSGKVGDRWGGGILGGLAILRFPLDARHPLTQQLYGAYAVGDVFPFTYQGQLYQGHVIERLVEHFGGLQKLLAASIDDLQRVEGVGETRARSVREGLSRLAESSILERYV